MIDCLEFRRRAGAEPFAVDAEVESHRRECAACARHLDELRGTLLKTHVEETFQRVVSRNEQRRSSRRSLPVRRFHYGYPPPQERRAVAERRTAEDRRYH